MGHLQVGLGLWSGFWEQPEAAPEAALEHQPPEPVDAVRITLTVRAERLRGLR